MSKSPRLLLALISVLTLLLNACGATDVGPASTSSRGGATLTVGLTYTPDIQFAPFYVAEQQGYFRAEGLNITLRHHGSSEPLLGALQAGTEQVVYAGGDEMMVARSQGIDVVSFATLYQTYPVVLIVPADSPIKSAADLAGHTIGVPGPYGETWYGLLALLQQGGLSQDQVKISNIGYTQQAALLSNKVDAVMGFSNNDVVHFHQVGAAVRAIALDASKASLVGVGLGASGKLVASDPDTLRKLTRAVTKGIQFCIDNPEQAVDLSTSYVPNLDQPTQQAVALAALKATAPLFGSQIGAQHPEQWSAMSAFLAGHGLISQPVPPDQAYTKSIVS